MNKTLTRLFEQHQLNRQELTNLIIAALENPQPLFRLARETTARHYGDSVFIRGLIEFSNYCSRNCLYCGIQRANRSLDRYRLTEDEILDCCHQGAELGYNSYVLQSGEDGYYTDEILVRIIRRIKQQFPKAAIALSIGERDFSSYQQLYRAGASRFLLRHETANQHLYHRFHPQMSFTERQQCLLNLRKAGFNIGAGFLVGLPGQSLADLVDDLLFLKQLQPEMVGIGPFIAHPATPLGGYKNGSLEITLIMLAIARLLLPFSLIPATTAVTTLKSAGRSQALLAGANVVMPNLTPTAAKVKYELYKNKAGIADDSQQALNKIKNVILQAGLIPDLGRGDPVKTLINRESAKC